MLPATRQAWIQTTSAILATDGTITPEERARLLSILKLSDTKTPTTPAKRILRRAAVAELLSCTTRTVDALALAGTLKRFKLPGRKQSAGFLESDVMALLDGKAAA